MTDYKIREREGEVTYGKNAVNNSFQPTRFQNFASHVKYIYIFFHLKEKLESQLAENQHYCHVS